MKSFEVVWRGSLASYTEELEINLSGNLLIWARYHEEEQRHLVFEFKAKNKGTNKLIWVKTSKRIWRRSKRRDFGFLWSSSSFRHFSKKRSVKGLEFGLLRLLRSKLEWEDKRNSGIRGMKGKSHCSSRKAEFKGARISPIKIKDKLMVRRMIQNERLLILPKFWNYWKPIRQSLVLCCWKKRRISYG